MGDHLAGGLIVRGIAECCMMTGSNLAPHVQAMIAQNILMDFPMMKMDEVFLAMGKGIKGEYAEAGKPAVYGSLNMQTIYQWLRTYQDEKLNRIDAEHEIKKNSAGSPNDRDAGNPKLLKNYTK